MSSSYGWKQLEAVTPTRLRAGHGLQGYGTDQVALKSFAALSLMQAPLPRTKLWTAASKPLLPWAKRLQQVR